MTSWLVFDWRVALREAKSSWVVILRSTLLAPRLAAGMGIGEAIWVEGILIDECGILERGGRVDEKG